VEKDLQARFVFLDFPAIKIRVFLQPIKPTLLRKMELRWKTIFNPYRLGKQKI
jgi:hypothetical protein